MRDLNVPPSHRVVAGLYWLVVAVFVALEPWGNVDTRDFSYMGRVKFWEYNAYIVFVLVSMIGLGIVLWKERIGLRTLLWMAVVNTMFAVMCLFDLIHFFPDPAQPMPFLVVLIEVVDTLAVLAILAYAPRLAKLATGENST